MFCTCGQRVKYLLTVLPSTINCMQRAMHFSVQIACTPVQPGCVLPVRSYLCHNHSVWLDIDLTASVVRFGSFVLRLCSILGVSDALNNFGREVGHGMFDRREMARLC